MKRGTVKVGDQIEFLFTPGWSTPKLETGVVIGCHMHKMSVIVQLKERSTRQLVKWDALQRVIGPASIDELLTDNHGRLRKLGCRLLAKEQRHERQTSHCNA